MLNPNCDFSKFISLKSSGRQIIGVDFSDNKIGVAISNWVVTIPFIIIKDRPIQNLKKICTDFNIIGAVIGYPLNMDGSVGRQAKKVQLFADVFLSETNVEYILFDERLTTFEARSVSKENTDAIAAKIILESFLRKHNILIGI